MDQNLTMADDELWGVPPPAPGSTVEEGGGGGKAGHRRRWLVAGLGTVAIAVAAIVGANLASSGTQGLAAAGQGGPGGGGGPGGFGGGGPGGRGNGGTIASIDGSIIKLTTDDGTTVSVVTSASTTVTASSTGAVGDIRVGDNVQVMGTTSGSTLAADRVTDSGTTALADGFGGGGRGGPPPGATGQGAAPANGAAANAPANGAPGGANGPRGNFGPPTAGVVKSVNGATFTVTASDGSTLTVSTSPATVVTLVKPSTVQALKAGDTIQVNGTTASDGTITATNIRSGVVGRP